MRTFRVYQVNIADCDADEINALGWSEASRLNPKVEAYLETSINGSSEWKPKYFDSYNPVALVKADDLEGVFRTMNLWDDPEAVTELVDDIHSLSVGDIIQDEQGYFMVDSVGFSKISVS